MNTRSLALAGGLFLLLGFVAAPAYADCAEKIKELEQRQQQITSDRMKTSEMNALNKIEEAKQALKEGKKKKCDAKARAADKILRKLGQ